MEAVLLANKEKIFNFTQGKILTIQFPIVFTIFIIVLGDILLRRARFFRQNYYIGGNEKAAIMTGIKVNKIKIFNYILLNLITRTNIFNNDCT